MPEVMEVNPAGTASETQSREGKWEGKNHNFPGWLEALKTRSCVSDSATGLNRRGVTWRLLKELLLSEAPRSPAHLFGGG